MSIRRLFLNVFVFIGVIFLGSSVAVAQEGKGALFAVLSGGNEVDGATGEANVGDGNGHGSATLIIVGQDTICYGVTVNRIDDPVAMHIHEAAAGSNGGVVIGLTPPDTGSPGSISDCVTELDAQLLRKIFRNPANYYVNIHNPAFPAGAIRGQLH